MSTNEKASEHVSIYCLSILTYDVNYLSGVSALTSSQQWTVAWNYRPKDLSPLRCFA